MTGNILLLIISILLIVFIFGKKPSWNDKPMLKYLYYIWRNPYTFLGLAIIIFSISIVMLISEGNYIASAFGVVLSLVSVRFLLERYKSNKILKLVLDFFLTHEGKCLEIEKSNYKESSLYINVNSGWELKNQLNSMYIGNFLSFDKEFIKDFKIIDVTEIKLIAEDTENFIDNEYIIRVLDNSSEYAKS